MMVFVVRHGQSESNERGLWTGQMDVPLTEQGRLDAKRAGGLIAPVTFDHVFSSDLSRAVETAQIAVPGCTPERLCVLREVDVGDLMGQPIDCLTDAQREDITAHGYRAFNGEPAEDFRARVEAFRHELEQMDYKNVAVFTHGGWLKEFMLQVLGVRIPTAKLRFGNCAVGVFEYQREKDDWRFHSIFNPL